MSLKLAQLFKEVNSFLRIQSSRNLGIIAPVFQKASDPIQQLFIDKLREHRQKSSGGNIVDSTPEKERELKQELQKLAIQYGGKEGMDMTKFPAFKFQDKKLDSINLDD